MYQVRCKCECGKEVDVLLTNLMRGRTKSCGCLKDRLTLERSQTHGQSKTRMYRIWAGMLDRCKNPKNKVWKRYGGRGISVCPEWSSFEPFFRWAKSNGYAKELTLHRDDNDGNYEASNCVWTDKFTQANARSNNRLTTAWGQTKTTANWSRDQRCVVSHEVLQSRVELGWVFEQAMTTPCRKMGLTEEERRERLKARDALNGAVRAGRIRKPGHCQQAGCRTPDVQAHHHRGYSRENWLDVVWLCKKHHRNQ